jgi:hypothetical protein
MATHHAEIRFPDGTVKYGRYSTVSESLTGRLSSSMVREGFRYDNGWMMADDDTIYGEPDAEHPDAPLSPPDRMIPVTIVEGVDLRSWGAVYCPSRGQLVGPWSPHMVYRFQDTYELVSDSGGLLHLMDWRHLDDAGPSVCGVTGLGTPIVYHCEYNWPGRKDPAEHPPSRDLFAEWATGRICRPCLLRAMERDVVTEIAAHAPKPRPPAPPPTFWQTVRRILWK